MYVWVSRQTWWLCVSMHSAHGRPQIVKDTIRSPGGGLPFSDSLLPFLLWYEGWNRTSVLILARLYRYSFGRLVFGNRFSAGRRTAHRQLLKSAKPCWICVPLSPARSRRFNDYSLLFTPGIFRRAVPPPPGDMSRGLIFPSRQAIITNIA